MRLPNPAHVTAMSIRRIALFYIRVALVLFGLATAVWAQSTMPQSAQTGASDPAGGPAAAYSTFPAGQTAATTGSLNSLVEILKDDAARAALIRELEAAAAGTQSTAPPASTSGSPSNTTGTPAADGPAATTAPTAATDTQQPAETEAATAPADGSDAASDEEQTLASRTVKLTRSIVTGAIVDLEEFWLRLKRVPNTLQQASRGLSEDVILQILTSLGSIVVCVYSTLIVLRLTVRPIRRRLNRLAEGSGWLRRLGFRVGASLIEALLVPLSSFIGVVALTVLISDGAGLSSTQTTFLNGFFAVEMARVLVRLILSPRTTNLRIVTLGDGASLSLWRLSMLLIYLLGYGQVLFVPIVEDLTSVFVARSVASVLGALTVLATMIYVLVKRQAVVTWMGAEPEAKGVRGMLAYLADRWHWPVLIYLLYLLAIVMTRPGNVLLPLLLKTALVLATIIGGLVARSAIAASMSHRVHVPKFVSGRLPLLEERLNQLIPAGLMILRVIIMVAVVATILDIVDLIDFTGFLSTELGVEITARVVGVLIVILISSIIWLAVSSWVDFRLNPFVGKAPTPREITLLTLLRNAFTIALVIVATMFCLSELGMNIGPLLASAGVLGLALSWGSQKMVEDIITGIFIQFENAMNVGDVVDVGGTVGTVEKLTVRSVTLRDLSGVVHMIPFSSASKIANYMRDFAYHVADMGVAYREEVDEVHQAMLDAFEELRENPDHSNNILGDLEWFGLNSFGDSALVVRARIKTKPGQQWGIGRAYNSILKRIFDERSIEIPYPHQTLYFGEDKHGRAPALHLRMERARQRAAAKEDDAIEMKAKDTTGASDETALPPPAES